MLSNWSSASSKVACACFEMCALSGSCRDLFRVETGENSDNMLVFKGFGGGELIKFDSSDLILARGIIVIVTNLFPPTFRSLVPLEPDEQVDEFEM